MKILAERLTELRKEKGISQAELARALQVSYSVVCYWESDRSEPTAPNLMKLADYFEVSTDYLLGRTDF
ncbi:MAG: helix-turn-helix transcriptional regulator [Clostridia bacterium]|nr:helix-turn-helix transcriptional regulator [Clostridia bacterium]